MQDLPLGALAAPWRACGGVLEVYLFEQRLQALVLELLADYILYKLRRRMHSRTQQVCRDLGSAAASAAGVHPSSAMHGKLGQALDVDIYSASMGKVLEACPETWWLRVAVGCMVAASDLRQQGRRVGPAQHSLLPAGRLPVLPTNGLWSSQLDNRPLPYATTMLALVEALAQVGTLHCT